MASHVVTSKETLPSIRSIFPPSLFVSLSVDDDMLSTPFTQKKVGSHDAQYHAPHLPISAYANNNNRRVSTFSDCSMPSLTYSPSPTPSPSPSCSSSQHIRLIPCALQVADVVIVATNPSSSSPTSFSNKGATLLTGPAIRRVAKDDRKMHPYRVVRERRE